jgi:hypothetical protein
MIWDFLADLYIVPPLLILRDSRIYLLRASIGGGEGEEREGEGEAGKQKSKIREGKNKAPLFANF